MGQTKSKYVMEMEPDSSFSHADPDEAIEMFEEDSRQVPSVVENVEPFPASPKAFEEPLQAGKETDKAVKGKVVNTNPDAKPYGGKEVSIVNSFDGWKTAHRMYKSENDFSLIIDLPNGKHEYAFVVDGKRDNLTKIGKDGVENNVVIVKSPAATDQTEENMKTECEYGQKFPDESLYKKEPPTLPPHLSYVLLNYPPHDILDPSTLPIPQHVTVNHGYTLVDESSGVKILAVTQRVKSKFVTTTFYKPVEADS